MSGLVVAYGNVKPQEVDLMLGKVAHRGPYLSGVRELGAFVLAQNYLRADAPAAPENAPVPFADRADPDLRICYDGQIGNSKALAARLELEDGPFLDERILLKLYREKRADMLDELDDAIFAFVISDGHEMLAARDLLGIKTLFYGRRGDDLFLASELKSLVEVTNDIQEFPPGHWMDGAGATGPFAQLPETPPPISQASPESLAAGVQGILGRSLNSRLDLAVPTGSLLSGGLDSSVISYLAGELYKERHGLDARLPTFALGVGVSEDIINARLLAEHIGSEHHELIVDIEQLFDVLPEVIYHLESFDPSLVRSAVANFLMSRYAREHGIEVLLSGEGGDEMFCGYLHMADLAPEELFDAQIASFGYLHSNASLRLDRMNLCSSIRVVTPFISGELFDYVLAIPGEYKLRTVGDKKIEKWILRRAYAPFLPTEIIERTKQEFSQGSGVADLLPARIEPLVSDAELAATQSRFAFIRSKEECYYFRLFGEHFGYGPVVDTVGQWLSL